MSDGVILINKPQGITSFSAVAQVRRRLGVKCGHCGTLDPMATGLLPVMCGKATKLCSYLTDGDKAYRAALRFGIETDTHDITGNVTETDDRRFLLRKYRRCCRVLSAGYARFPPHILQSRSEDRRFISWQEREKRQKFPNARSPFIQLKRLTFPAKSL